MELSNIQWIVLNHVRDVSADLRKVSALYRHVLIDLGMAEPPLVDVRADEIFITAAGCAALKANPNY